MAAYRKVGLKIGSDRLGISSILDLAGVSSVPVCGIASRGYGLLLNIYIYVIGLHYTFDL